jgi:hypothetical protein
LAFIRDAVSRMEYRPSAGGYRVSKKPAAAGFVPFDCFMRRPKRPHLNAGERRNGVALVDGNETLVAHARSVTRQRTRRRGDDEAEVGQPTRQGREGLWVHVVRVGMRAKNQIDCTEFVRSHGRGRHALM